MRQEAAFYYAMGWNPSTVDFDIWLGNATKEAIDNLGPRAKRGELVGFEPADKHPSGWACRAPGR